MGRYTTSSEFFQRYSQIADYGSDRVESHFIYYAENELDSMLCNYFTVPFSSDNITAKDIAMDLAYLRSGDLKFSEGEKRREYIMNRINDIISGKIGMMVSSGQLLSIGDTIYSSTSTYHPTFGMGDIENYPVDEDLIESELLDRSI